MSQEIENIPAASAVATPEVTADLAGLPSAEVIEASNAAADAAANAKAAAPTEDSSATAATAKGGNKPEIKPMVAHAENPTISAVVHALFRFQTLEQARYRLNNIRTYFIKSKEQPPEADKLRLWIKGYHITEDEESLGFLGNFAVLHIAKLADNTITLVAQKDEQALSAHPQKKRPKQRHPNWGHPTMRSAKNKRTFADVEQAQSQLERLHRDHPEVTIPVPNKMFVMVFARGDDPEDDPIKKIVLEIKFDDDGKFYIDWSLNTYQKKGTRPSEAPEDKKGKFSAMVELKRASKVRYAEPLEEDADGKDADKATAAAANTAAPAEATAPAATADTAAKTDAE